MREDGHVSSPATYVFDGHNDLPWTLRQLCDYDLDAVDLLGGDTRVHTDLPRLRAGGVGAQFWSVYVPCRLETHEAVTATLEQVDAVHALAARYPEHLELADSADDVERIVGTGKVASLLGMEGGHSIADSLGVLRMMRRLGVRYLTLTHNENVPWADAATDDPVQGGLNDRGRDVVRELDRIGMFADLSHVSADTMRDTLDVTSAPVLFSHSSAFALVPNPRNVPDDVLARLAGNGGVCQVSFVPMFVHGPAYDWWVECQEVVAGRGENPRDLSLLSRVGEERARAGQPQPRGTVDDVADHVEHVREVAGLDHVGVGGDYDGADVFPEGMDDVSSYAVLWETLRGRGWSEAELARLGHGNVLRALRDLDAAATA